MTGAIEYARRGWVKRNVEHNDRAAADPIGAVGAEGEPEVDEL
jgi:hypothetical protein